MYIFFPFHDFQAKGADSKTVGPAPPIGASLKSGVPLGVPTWEGTTSHSLKKSREGTTSHSHKQKQTNEVCLDIALPASSLNCSSVMRVMKQVHNE